VGDEEKLMIAVDRLKTLIQRLGSLGNVVTEASKIERIKDGLKSAKYKLLVVSMEMQPPITTFDQLVSMIKNFDKAIQDEAKWGIGETSLGEIHLCCLHHKRNSSETRKMFRTTDSFQGVSRSPVVTNAERRII
jgi:hypothetical protein